MFNYTLPLEIAKIVNACSTIEDRKGRLGNDLYQLNHSSLGRCHLNVSSGALSFELLNEYSFLSENAGNKYLPTVLAYQKQDDVHYLLTSDIAGVPLHEVADTIPKTKVIEIIKLSLSTIASSRYSKSIGLGIVEEMIEIKKNMYENRIDIEAFKQATNLDPTDEFNILMHEAKHHSQNTLTHGDFCIPNIIVKDDSLSGLIDWGKVGIGDVYRDLSAMRGSLLRNFNIKLEDIVQDLGVSLSGLAEEKIEFYKRIDQFWYFTKN